MSDSDQLAQARMMENLYWWGIPSLFRCPIESDPANCGACGRSCYGGTCTAGSCDAFVVGMGSAPDNSRRSEQLGATLCTVGPDVAGLRGTKDTFADWIKRYGDEVISTF